MGKSEIAKLDALLKGGGKKQKASYLRKITTAFNKSDQGPEATQLRDQLRAKIDGVAVNAIGKDFYDKQLQDGIKRLQTLKPVASSEGDSTSSAQQAAAALQQIMKVRRVYRQQLRKLQDKARDTGNYSEISENVDTINALIDDMRDESAKERVEMAIRDLDEKVKSLAAERPEPEPEPKTKGELMEYLSTLDAFPSYEQLLEQGFGDVVSEADYKRMVAAASTPSTPPSSVLEADETSDEDVFEDTVSPPMVTPAAAPAPVMHTGHSVVSHAPAPPAPPSSPTPPVENPAVEKMASTLASVASEAPSMSQEEEAQKARQLAQDPRLQRLVEAGAISWKDIIQDKADPMLVSQDKLNRAVARLQALEEQAKTVMDFLLQAHSEAHVQAMCITSQQARLAEDMVQNPAHQAQLEIVLNGLSSDLEQCVVFPCLSFACPCPTYHVSDPVLQVPTGKARDPGHHRADREDPA